MKKIAVVSSILESPAETQKDFNNVVSSFKGMIKGRMGIPFDEQEMAVISLVVAGELDEINAFTGKLGNLAGCTVKTAISRREID